MRHVVAAFAIAVIAVLLVGGCSGPNRPAWASFDPDDWANRSITDEPILLDVAGPVAVDVESFNGDVIIKGNPKLSQAKVTVVRAAIHGYERRDEALASLDDIRYSVNVVPGELGQVLQVITTTSNPEPHFQRAHVYIEIPVIDGVTVKTSNGKVYARSIQGPVDIATTYGSVRVMTNLPMTDPVTIVNKSGDIDYRVRGESTGKIDAQTIHGRVNHVVRYATMIVTPPTREDRLVATFNDGTNPITLRTVNGDIRIAVVHNPEQVGDFIVD